MKTFVFTIILPFLTGVCPADTALWAGAGRFFSEADGFYGDWQKINIHLCIWPYDH
jgi:hypothetical protein